MPNSYFHLLRYVVDSGISIQDYCGIPVIVVPNPTALTWTVSPSPWYYCKFCPRHCGNNVKSVTIKPAIRSTMEFSNKHLVIIVLLVFCLQDKHLLVVPTVPTVTHLPMWSSV